jgi:hypothetical protein
VDQFALFRSKLYSAYRSPLVTVLPGTLEVPASRLYIPAKYEKVQIVGEADCNEASIVAELGIETGGIKEEENRRE